MSNKCLRKEATCSNVPVKIIGSVYNGQTQKSKATSGFRFLGLCNSLEGKFTRLMLENFLKIAPGKQNKANRSVNEANRIQQYARIVTVLLLNIFILC